ncbi:MAG: hypothetical protein ACOCZH_00385, partial [Phototrophicaceae bacterium]
LGHYARVLAAVDQRSKQNVAFKVLRPEHLDANGDIRWEYRAFANEAELLVKLRDSPHVVDLIDCGYISTPSENPADGRIVSYQGNVAGFIHAQPEHARKGWRPYLALPHLPRTNNLFYAMKPAQAGVRWRLPTEEGLALAIQFAHVLEMAHEQSIVYLDHKLEHLYWDGLKLEVIDFNSSRQLDSNTNSDAHFLRMDIHNLCVGILYSVFTGLSPQKTTLRPQPSNRSAVEARYQDITSLDFGVEPTLSPALQKLLQRGANMEIETVDEFLEQLQQVAAVHGWDFPDQYTTAADRDGRGQMRAALRKLRAGQASIREARDLLFDAAILDDISEDMEDELRRLVKAANDMLNHRVIP